MASARRRKETGSRLSGHDLDAPCGRHFSYRQLVECGDTWTRLSESCGVDNSPRQPETYAALRELCRVALDPLVDRFGAVTLTYGFAARALVRHVPGGIAPALDQHASCELTRSGRQICGRGGAAADFTCPGTSSAEVARWASDNLKFDRLYFYGADRPIHLSVGPQGARSIVIVTRTAGRVLPRPVSAEAFREHLDRLVLRA